MSVSAEQVRSELLAMAAHDLKVRAKLAADGSLFDGYHPAMERVHRQHARRLSALIDTMGWPNALRVGADAAEAAWLIVQHAISCPQLQRRGLALLQVEAAHGRVDASHVAMLEDRIRVFEGRPQRYGTQFDWDATGMLNPCPIEDPDRVDDRRSAAGLPPLDEATAQRRQRADDDGETAPHDPSARAAEFDAWAHRVGWRS